MIKRIEIHETKESGYLFLALFMCVILTGCIKKDERGKNRRLYMLSVEEV